MWKFIKEKIFFLIDKGEKEYIRQRVMHSDNRIYFVVMVSILCLEIVMLSLSIFGVDSSSARNIENGYCIMYIFLASICIVCLIFMNLFFKKKKALPYYVFVCIFMFATMLWGAGVSVLTSLSAFSVLYFTLALITCSAFICIEPWVSTLCVGLSTTTFVVLYYNIDGVQRTDNGIFISVIALTVVIVLFAFYFNFYRRIDSIKLELQVSKLNQVLEGKAYIDDLTGVKTRRYLTENIDAPLHYDDLKSGVLMLDIDYFKNINDTYGHQVGDLCLKELGIHLNEFIANEKAYCVRYGGEEFLVYFDETNEQSLYDLAEKFRKKIAKTNILIPGGVSVHFTISIGVALAHDNISYNSLIYEADDALYKAKEKRNNTVVYK